MRKLIKPLINRRRFIRSSVAGLLAVNGLTGYLQAGPSPTRSEKDTAAEPPAPGAPDCYNIAWDSPSRNASGSMPVGGGDLGLNVWVEDGDLLFYLQRSGSLDENGEYLKLGRVRIRLTPNLFTAQASFRQELVLRKGLVEIEARTGDGQHYVLIRVWVDISRSAVHVDIDSAAPVMATASYESWRFKDQELPAEGRRRFSTFSLEGYPGKIIKRKDSISHTTDGVLFYHRNSADKPLPGLLIRQQGLEKYADEIFDDLENRTFGGILYGENFIPAGTGTGEYAGTPFNSWHIASRKKAKKHRLVVATHLEQAAGIGPWKEKLRALLSDTLSDPAAGSTAAAWWQEFWNRSWIILFPGKSLPGDPVWQMGRNYQVFRYQLGCNALGEYPSKFNGGNLTFDPVLVKEDHPFDPDWRAWGGNDFTAQNQRLLHWPMLKSGDFDLVTPQLGLYTKGLPGAKARVKAYFGHEGAMFGEYMNAQGLDFGPGWGWKNGMQGRVRGEEIPFGDPRIDGLSGYGKPVEAGIMANPYVSYHWEAQVEHAYMALELHRYTGRDISRYLPFVKEALIFFDKHYRLRKKIRDGHELDPEGKLVFYPSTACETFRGATNPTDLVSGLKASLTALLQLDEKYLTTAEKAYFSDYLRRIPDLPFDKSGDAPVIRPARDWLARKNTELPQFYPLFPFNQFKPGDPEIEIFKNTYRSLPDDWKGNIVSWHQDGIFLARMGMTVEAARYNTRKLQDSDRRFPTFWGPGHDWVPDHNWGGSGMAGLQEMLMQTIDNKIVLLPAWPREWDVSFKLHAPFNTTVEAEFVNGRFEKILVQPPEREKDLVLPPVG